MSGRRYLHPEPGDTLEAIASRELADHSDAADQLLGWNLHLAARPGGLLPSDVVFVEPPAPR